MAVVVNNTLPLPTWVHISLNDFALGTTTEILNALRWKALRGRAHAKAVRREIREIIEMGPSRDSSKTLLSLYGWVSLYIPELK